MLPRIAMQRQARRRKQEQRPKCPHCHGSGKTPTLPFIEPPSEEIMIRVGKVAEGSPVGSSSVEGSPTEDSILPTGEPSAVESSTEEEEGDAVKSPSDSLLPLEEVSSDLDSLLQSAQAEIKRLKDVLFRTTKDGLTIVIPVPALNSTGLLDTSQYEIVKALYSGVILDMIQTVHQQFELQNRKAYSFYQVEEKELKLTFTVTDVGTTPIETPGETPSELPSSE